MTRTVLAVIVSLFAATSFAADLSEADGRKWVERVRKLVPREGWTVTVSDNDIVIQRTKPVPMLVFHANDPIWDGKTERKPSREQTIRFVLRFGPKLAIDEYDRLAAINEASNKEHDRLKSLVRVTHKFDDFLPSTPEEKERVRLYREAVAKLPRHELPDLYTPEHSVTFLHSWDGWSSPHDKIIKAECDEVQESILRYFGVYNPAVATNNRGVGRYLPEAKP